MTIFEYAECHCDEVELDISVENIEVGAKKNVILDDMALSSKEKSLLCSLD